MKYKTWIAISCISLGLWFVGQSGYMLAKSHFAHYLIKDAWQKTLIDDNNHKPWSWADTYPVFEISFPSIGTKNYVLEGANGRNMAFSVAHVSASGMPGQQKTTILSAHRDSHFNYLQHLKIGDEIITTSKNQTTRFRVINTRVINTNSEKLQIRNIKELLLTTCYPFNSIRPGGNLRYVVYAIPTKYSVIQNS
jgi:sortase A